ncbi:MAG: hypothetical protein OEY14_08190 [Myxococcales bacterium]|nr:hypothetical protein [Myxococcales bacterium]
MDFIIGPDVYVNASVALGSPPEHVTRRALGGNEKQRTSEWIMQRVEAMFRSIPSFKEESVGPQMQTIRSLVEIVDQTEFAPEAWQEALICAAKAAGVERIVTDHPDLVELDEAEGIEFMTTDGWLVEQTLPPPLP